MGKFQPSLVELWNRAVVYFKTKDYYSNGDDDKYSERIERLIENSPIGSRVADIFSTFVAGRGVENDYVVYGDTFLSEIITETAENLVFFGGVYIHRSLKIDEQGDFVTDKIKVLDYHRMRIGRSGDDDEGGKFWLVPKENTKKPFFFYPFSSNQNVILEQVNNDSKSYDIKEKIKAYRGQVMYVSLTPKYVYGLSPFDSVINDLDTDYRISLYSNSVLRNGFLGKQMVLFQSGTDEEDKAMKDNIKGWLGAENASNIFVSSVNSIDDIDKNIVIKKAESDYNDQMFENTTKRIERNILGAGANVPYALIFNSDNSLFGGSGEQLIQLKKFYNEQTTPYRKLIENKLLLLGITNKIIEITDEING